jgi:hypothetical protein
MDDGAARKATVAAIARVRAAAANIDLALSGIIANLK